MITVKDIAFVRYQANDLELMEKFMSDFGLHRVDRTTNALYLRACGPAHHCHITELGDTNETLGIGFYAQSEADLGTLAAEVGSRVEANLEPGGGKRVRFRDPMGFLVDVIHGQATVPKLPHREALQVNSATGRARLGRPVRLKPQPSCVMRLGHAVLVVTDFEKTVDFYTRVLGFRTSDTYYAGHPDNKIAAFLHCGLGSEWTDHHTLAVIASSDGINRFDHTAFEVLDMDDLVQGNEHLKSKGWKHSWGMGRHIQGSQLFDYWRDPFGNKVEHWTDGDLVNDDTPVSNAPISNEELSQWAPSLNPEFFA